MLQIFGNPPFFTFVVFVLCIVVFLFQPSITATCLSATSIVSDGEFLRILTYPFIHLDIIHAILNLIAWITMARQVEYTLGTLPTIYTVLIILTPLNAAIQIGSSYVLDALLGTAFAYQCSVGLSGLLFSFLVMNIKGSGSTHTTVCGLFDVPSFWYPFLLVAVIQLIFPQISLLGHLAGIASAHLLIQSLLRPFIPTNDTFSRIEARLRLLNWPAWQPVPSFFTHLTASVADSLTPLLGHPTPSRPGFGTRFSRRMSSIWQWTKDRFSGQRTADDNGDGHGSGDASTSGNTEAAPRFSGHGRQLGGAVVSSGGPQGSVPATSRLLQSSSVAPPQPPPAAAVMEDEEAVASAEPAVRSAPPPEEEEEAAGGTTRR